MSLGLAKCSQTKVKMPPLFSEVTSEGEDVGMREKPLHIPTSFHSVLMGMAGVEHTGWVPQWLFFPYLPPHSSTWLSKCMSIASWRPCSWPVWPGAYCITSPGSSPLRPRGHHSITQAAELDTFSEGICPSSSSQGSGENPYSSSETVNSSLWLTSRSNPMAFRVPPLGTQISCFDALSPAFSITFYQEGPHRESIEHR